MAAVAVAAVAAVAATARPKRRRKRWLKKRKKIWALTCSIKQESLRRRGFDLDWGSDSDNARHNFRMRIQ